MQISRRVFLKYCLGFTRDHARAGHAVLRSLEDAFAGDGGPIQ